MRRALPRSKATPKSPISRTRTAIPSRSLKRLVPECAQKPSGACQPAWIAPRDKPRACSPRWRARRRRRCRGRLPPSRQSGLRADRGDHSAPRRPSGRDQKCLRGGLLHAGLEPLYLARRLALAGVDGLQQLPVAGALGGLPDHCPRDVARVRHEVQVLHVAQEAEAARPGLVEELMVQILGLLGLLLAVALDERP